MAKSKPRTVDVNLPQLGQIVDAGLEAPLTPEGGKQLKDALDVLAALLPSRTSEKLSQLAGMSRKKPEDAPPAPGHGRRAADAYEGAHRVTVSHPTLCSGSACPDPDCRGKVYPLKKGRLLIRIYAVAPIDGTIYDCQKLRCNCCETVYSAPLPDGVGEAKFDESVASMVAIFKYGMGVPFNRLEGLQEYLKVPLPKSTQWDLVEEAAELVKPVYEELKTQIAQAPVLHTDDTNARILKVLRDADDKRTGLHTTGVVGTLADEIKRNAAVYVTGKQHAGENIRDVLGRRAPDAPAPILMSDALSWNASKLDKSVLTADDDEAAVLLANCLAHGRRKIVEQYGNRPSECLHILQEIAEVYVNDDRTRELGLDAKERLKYHQTHSGPIMKRLHQWMTDLFANKVLEPNSALGKAIQYFLTHWKALTLFLRQPGAPIDNNVVERALKKAVLHRKNALFFKTLHGAEVADIFMSIIHTCELNNINPFEYFNELQRHPMEARANPAAWLPWTYPRPTKPAPAPT